MIIAKKKIKKRYVVLLFVFLIILGEFLKSEYISQEVEKLKFGYEGYIYVCIFNETDNDNIKLSIRSNEGPRFKAPDVIIPSKSASLFVMDMQDMPSAYDCLVYNYEIDGVDTKVNGRYFHPTKGIEEINWIEEYGEGYVIENVDNQYTISTPDAPFFDFAIPEGCGRNRFVWCQFLEKHFGTYTTQVVKLEIEDTAN